MGLKADLSCLSIIQNLCACPLESRDKNTKQLAARKERCSGGGMAASRGWGLAPSWAGRSSWQEARHDLGTGREGKGKHCSAGPAVSGFVWGRRCSPSRKKTKNQKQNKKKTAARPPADLFAGPTRAAFLPAGGGATRSLGRAEVGGVKPCRPPSWPRELGGARMLGAIFEAGSKESDGPSRGPGGTRRDGGGPGPLGFGKIPARR